MFLAQWQSLCFFFATGNSILLLVKHYLYRIFIFTIQIIFWYFINILTTFEVPAAILISRSFTVFVFDLEIGDKNRFGAIIIATLFNPIKF